jgi:hypothetical protein
MLIALCLLCTSIGFAQNKLSDKFAEMDDVTSVYISKAHHKICTQMTRIYYLGSSMK